MPLPILAIGLGILASSVVYKAVKVSGELQDKKETYINKFKKNILLKIEEIETSEHSVKAKAKLYKSLIKTIQRKQDNLNKSLLTYELEDTLEKQENILFRYKFSKESVVRLMGLYITTYNKLPF